MSDLSKDLIHTYRVRMNDGSEWDIPAVIIAEDRARYYSKGKDIELFNQEVEIALTDASELADWAMNNMNWDDVKDHATQSCPPINHDYSKDWSQGDTAITFLNIDGEIV